MRKFFLAILFIISFNLLSQSIPITMPTAYNPATKWKSIKTTHFKIIYDELIEEDAQDIANKLEALFTPLSETMGDEIHPFTIVLTSRNVVTNGFVSPINNHSEFFPIPPTSSHGTTEWYTSLVIHEGRHMAQFSNIRDSLLQKVTGILMGSNNVIFGALIPLYFFEGDAVLAETLLTDSGRGREPSFERGLRTILLSGEDYSFQKALYRSSNDFYPNHYVLGYYLMTYLRREYGDDVLSRIIDSAANDPFPLNFSRHCYFVTGKTIVTIYHEVMAELKEKWEEQDSKTEKTQTIKLISSDSAIYTNRLYPQMNHKGDLVYLKTDLDGKSHLYKNNDKHIRLYGGFSLFKEKIVFSDTGKDIRWDSKGYSDIFIYNLNSREKIQLTNRERFFYPAFSNDGTRIAAVEYNLNRIPSLVILNSTNGEVIKKIQFNRGDGISSPSWNISDDEIVISRITEEGNCLGVVNINNGDFRNITGYNNISKYNPVFNGDNILFTSSYSGIENIHAINKETGAEYQIVSSRYGVDFPSINNNKVIFSCYTLNGYEIDSYTLDEDLWIPIDEVSRNHVDYFEPLIKQEQAPVTDFPEKEYNSQKYNPNLNLIDVHAWLYSPFYSFIQRSDVNKNSDSFDVHELILFSNDRLGIMESRFYTHYNIRNKSFDLGSIGTYKGIFPEISWDFNFYSKEPVSGFNNMNLLGTIVIPLNFTYSNQSLGFGITAETFRDFDIIENSEENLSYFISYSYNIPEFYFNSKLSYKHYIRSDYTPQLKLSNTIAVEGPLRRSYFNFINTNKWSLGSGYGFSEIDFVKDEGSLIFTNTPSSTQEAVKSAYFFSGLYYIPLFYPEISIINWVFIDSVGIAPGYEGALSPGNTLKQIVKFTAKLDYRLLRIPGLSFYSQFTGYYDFNKEKYDYNYIPIYFTLRL